MPFRKSRSAATYRPAPPAVPVPNALTAARRALEQQTALVAHLEARIRQLTARQQPALAAVEHLVLDDTEIYWRRRHHR